MPLLQHYFRKLFGLISFNPNSILVYIMCKKRYKKYLAFSAGLAKGHVSFCHYALCPSSINLLLSCWTKWNPASRIWSLEDIPIFIKKVNFPWWCSIRGPEWRKISKSLKVFFSRTEIEMEHFLCNIIMICTSKRSRGYGGDWH